MTKAEVESAILAGRTPFARAYALQMRWREELQHDPRRVARVLALEHDPVYTLGRATKPEHLGLPAEELARRSGADVLAVDRGGSVTYHGPGQATLYLLLNLRVWNFTIHQHIENLEEIALRALGGFGVRGERIAGMTGVWVPAPAVAGGLAPTPPAKICAIGAGCRRHVTYHGLALNVDLDLAPFARVDPCGLGRRPVTCLARLLSRTVGVAEVQAALVRATGDVLAARVTSIPVAAE